METRTTRNAGRHTATTAEVIEGLNDLLQLDHDAVGAYEVAIERLDDRDHADQIAGFKRDHERHIRELNEMIARLGGTATNEPHATGPLKQALQSLGAMVGDKGVLLAWRANELQVRTKYDSYAASSTFWPDDVKRLIDQNALDEERHYEWVVRVLQHMGIGSGDELETDVATRVREAGVRAEVLVNRARDAAGDVVDATRQRAGDAVDATREKAGEIVDAARAKAGEIIDTSREKASDLAGATAHRAGDLSVAARNRVAEGLHAAAERLEEVTGPRTQPSGRLGGVGQRVAGGMHSSADYLREASLHGVAQDLESNVRHHPIRTLTVLFATGFVIGRLLR